MAEFKSAFFKLTGARWRLAMALAAVEQGVHETVTDRVCADEYAVGDNQHALGLWQMHAEFVETFAPKLGVWMSLMLVLRGDPWFQVAVMANFLALHAAADDHRTAMIFHYGHDTDQDPDGYWSKVVRALARTANALPEAA